MRNLKAAELTMVVGGQASGTSSGPSLPPPPGGQQVINDYSSAGGAAAGAGAGGAFGVGSAVFGAVNYANSPTGRYNAEVLGNSNRLQAQQNMDLVGKIGEGFSSFTRGVKNFVADVIQDSRASDY
jgi:hypothetical protein